jgi:hypothetical protein
VYVVRYIHIFVFEFFETLKYRFQKSSKEGLHGARVPNRFSETREAFVECWLDETPRVAAGNINRNFFEEKNILRLST